MFSLDKLNKEQLEAVINIDGPVLVIAGAGCGKTSVLTTRIAYLINNFNVDQNKILAFTFTNKAAKEMNERINKMIHSHYLPWIGTYHGICLKILKQDITFFGRKNDFSVIDEQDKTTIIKNIYKQYNIDYKKITTKKMIQIISKIKNDDISFEKTSLNDLLKIFDIVDIQIISLIKYCFNQYNIWLKKINSLDFDDLINLTHQLLTESDAIRTKWQNNFEFILVDEFQDTNIKQFELISLLLNKTKCNLFAVGDPNQTIYTWRGAYEKIFDDFISDYHGVKIIKLFHNYRSTQNIINAANSLIKYNYSSFQNNLIANNKNDYLVHYFEANSTDDECNYIVNKVTEEIKNNRKKYKDFAILYRANYVSRSIEEQLLKNSIPYIIYGGIQFYQRMEIKDIIAYLRAILFNDDISLQRIINIPKRKISDNIVDTILEYSALKKITFYEALLSIDDIQNISSSGKAAIKSFVAMIKDFQIKLMDIEPEICIKKIIDEIKYFEYLKSLDMSYESRIENIAELESSIASFFIEKPDANIIDFVNEVSLYSSLDKNDDGDKNDVLKMMTIHTAKGLEFDSVFIYNFVDGILPNDRAIVSNNLSEERRIAYVAITRAINHLYITSHSTNFSFRKKVPSRFVCEIGKNNFLEDSKKITTISNKDMGWFNSNVENKINLKEVYSNVNINYKNGDIVTHTVFGKGVIVSIKNGFLDIVFTAPFGRKTIISTHNSIKRLIN